MPSHQFLNSRTEFIDTIKLAYLSLKKTNLMIFGITKSKTLIDFVTTEADAKKGKTRMPLPISRIWEEDIMRDDEAQHTEV